MPTPKETINQLKNVINEHNIYYYVKDNPIISDSEYDELFKNFLKVLISRNQINLFQNIKEDFIRQVQSSTGKISAIITSAVKISDSQKELIIHNICKIFDVNEVDVQEKIDQKILGGLIINVGDTVIDISTSNKLENLKKHLLKTSTL